MTADKGTLLSLLTGGAGLKTRVQHPKVQECRDYKQWYWFFRYWHDELLPDGSVKTSRKRHICGDSRGPNKITHTRAEEIRDDFLHDLKIKAKQQAEGAAAQEKAAKEPDAPIDPRQIIFGKLAELWLKDYAENPKVKLAQPTREKYRIRMDTHILPRWKDARLTELDNSKAIVDWLQGECTSWWMMVDLRNIMSGVITRAQEWGIVPRSYANPMKWVKLGRKWTVWEDRILSDEETAAVFARLADPHLLICETCIYTGTRISEAVGLTLKCVDLKKGTIKIERRHCRGDVDDPKSASSKRVLALGVLIDRYAEWIGKKGIKEPNAWIFSQPEDSSKPMWDSGVRKALKLAAEDAKCDFPGFGLHSFRRANITLRQEVGGSAIEASKIAGHSGLAITGEYTKVQLRRQEELTRAIQDRIEEARRKQEAEAAKERSGNQDASEAAA